MNNLPAFLLCIFALGFFGCQHTTELVHAPTDTTESATRYTITYYIHADADYLYHSPAGNAVNGNSKVINTAMDVGKKALSGEVLIFYQRPNKSFLGLFPKNTSQFYHYKNGILIHQLMYRHLSNDEAFLTTENQLEHEYEAQVHSNDQPHYFLYFGHELPIHDGRGYHQSLPGINVSIASFVKGIQNLLPRNKDRYNLLVLSTCKNGSPEIANMLLPVADILLASPQDLHLSHIDSKALNMLEDRLSHSPLKLGISMGDQTFNRLTSTVRSPISLVLYDLEAMRNYMQGVSDIVAATNHSGNPLQTTFATELSPLLSPYHIYYPYWVNTWFKTASFGKRSQPTDNSF